MRSLDQNTGERSQKRDRHPGKRQGPAQKTGGRSVTGDVLPHRAGQIDRETGKLIDQFAEELPGLEKEVTLIVWREFLSELDIEVGKRKIKK